MNLVSLRVPKFSYGIYSAADLKTHRDSLIQKVQDFASGLLKDLSHIEIKTLFDNLHGAAYSFRKLITSADSVITAEVVKLHIGSWGDHLHHAFDRLAGPLDAARILYAVKIVDDVAGLSKSIGKFVKYEGTKKIKAAIKVINHLGSLFDNSSNFVTGLLTIEAAFEKIGFKTLSGTVKVLKIAGEFLGIISVIGSGADIVLKVRKIWIANKFLNQFKLEVGYDSKGNYTRSEYDKLRQFINETSSKTLSKQFEVDGDLVKYGINKLLPALDSNKTALDATEQNQLKEVMNTLKGRVVALQFRRATDIAIDSLDIITTALVVASVAQPYLLIAGSVLYGVSTTIQYAHSTCSDYRFQSKMGLIEGEQEKTNLTKVQKVISTVKNFAKWYFGINSLHKKGIEVECSA